MSSDQFITVDIDELIEKLSAIKEDDFTTVTLSIVGDEYISELAFSVSSFDSEEPISYGSINESSEEF